MTRLKQKPSLIGYDPISEVVFFCGRFEGMTHVSLPFIKSHSYEQLAIKTTIKKKTHFFLLAYNFKKRDLEKIIRKFGNTFFLMCRMMGSRKNMTKENLRLWWVLNSEERQQHRNISSPYNYSMGIVQKTQIKEVVDIDKVPDNYIFIRPIF